MIKNYIAQHAGFTDGESWFMIGKFDTCQEANSAAIKYKGNSNILVRVIYREIDEKIIWEDCRVL